jgi:hypothetical protein
MAFAGDISLDVPEVRELQRQLRQLPDNIYIKHLGAGINKALKPGASILKGSVPKGPTGNLRRSVGTKVKKYKKTLTVVGLVGYKVGGGGKSKKIQGGTTTIGSQHAYHQGLVEFGTKERKAKGRIASSYKTRGAFRLPGAEGEARPYKYPRDFFRIVPPGRQAPTGRMPIGGYVKRANDMAKDFMGSALRNLIAEQVRKAWSDLARVQAGGRG